MEDTGGQSKNRIYTVSLEDTRKIEVEYDNFEYAIFENHKRRISNTSESAISELKHFLKDFTFSDDIIHKTREWL